MTTEYQHYDHPSAWTAADLGGKESIGQPLDPCSEVGRLTDCQLGHRCVTSTRFADNNGTSRNANAHFQCRWSGYMFYCFNYFKRRTRCALGIIFMGPVANQSMS